MFPKLKSPSILSPMAGVTDIAFRELCKNYGVGMTYTEFVSSAALVRNNKKTHEMLRVASNEKPVAVQLFGANEQEVIKAAKTIQDKFDVIDINCGCPVHKVIKVGAGSAMLNDPQKIGKLVNKLVNAVNKPITVKIRTGINKEKINAVEIAKIVENAGASAIAVHGRTQKQAYSGKANWDIIKQVKESVNIPVIGNGDVFTPETYAQRLTESGVDAIMVARGAIGNPYLFKQINDYLKTGTYDTKDQIEVFFEYLKLAEKYKIAFGNIKAHALSFTKGVPKARELRNKLAQTNNIEEIKKLLMT